MTTRPRLFTGSSQAVGLLAVALFVVLSAVFLTADFGGSQGFAGVENVTAAIGYALFNIEADVVPPNTEGFLVAFVVIALVLDAALDAAVMLAHREEEPRRARADGGSVGEVED